MYGFNCLGLPSHQFMPLYHNLEYVKATRLIDSKEVQMPWDESQVRRVNLAILDDEEAAEQRVMEWQLQQMEQADAD